MRFSFQILVRLQPSPPGWSWKAVSPRLGIAGQADDEIRALESARLALRTWIDTLGVDYLRHWAESETELNCPETTLGLPSDDRHCKHTGLHCPIGGVVSKLDLEDSLSCCNAPEKAKSGVRGALRAGYSGLHHHSGSYFCGECKSEEMLGYTTKALRFPFELQDLMQVVDLIDKEKYYDVKRELIINNINSNATYVGRCPDCLVKLVKRIKLPEELNLHVISLDYKTKF